MALPSEPLRAFGCRRPQAGSSPGGRVSFFVRTKKETKESRPASTPLAAQGIPCAARSTGWLRNSALWASNSPRHRRYASEPDASVLLGVSEGEVKASMCNRDRIFVARILTASRETATVLTLGPVESAEPRSGVGGSALSADGEDCLSGGRSPARVPQPPDFASSAGKSGAQRLTANGGSGVSRSTAPRRWSGQCVQTLHYFGCPSLWFLSLGQARERNPAAGTDSRPTRACRLAQRRAAQHPTHSTPSVKPQTHSSP
ncbi:hypothetical protein GGR36_004256 [Niveibacterium umoris]|uniref:Uncharacterized protein n=1 Tax=Niveibacterium umoris TaxID=1193620 RepID=A0A840BTQ9_9RHOO|nr:hypothetical protein [Niveibacterium umoris]